MMHFVDAFSRPSLQIDMTCYSRLLSLLLQLIYSDFQLLLFTLKLVSVYLPRKLFSYREPMPLIHVCDCVPVCEEVYSPLHFIELRSLFKRVLSNIMLSLTNAPSIVDPSP